MISTITMKIIVMEATEFRSRHDSITSDGIAFGEPSSPPPHAFTPERSVNWEERVIGRCARAYGDDRKYQCLHYIIIPGNNI